MKSLFPISWNTVFERIATDESQSFLGEVIVSDEANVRAKMLIYLIENKSQSFLGEVIVSDTGIVKDFEKVHFKGEVSILFR